MAPEKADKKVAANEPNDPKDQPKENGIVEPVKDVKPGETCETKLLISRYNKDGDVEVIERDNKPNSDDPYVEYALVSKQMFDENHKLTSTVLDINSPTLLSVLKDVITYYPGEPLDFKTKFTIDSPYQMLYHHRKELNEYYHKTEDEAAKSHVALLEAFLDGEETPKDLEAKAMIENGLIDFDRLWRVFKPGDLLYEHKYGHCRLFSLRKTGYGQHKTGGRYFEISCSFTSFDGKRVGTAGDKLRIWEKQEFLGQAASQITSLSVFPLKFQSASEIVAVKEKLVERGLRYLEIKEMGVRSYNGLFLYLKRPPHDFYSESAQYNGSWLPETTNGRVVIDPKTFNEEQRAQKEELASYDSDDSGNDSSDNDDDDKKAKGSPLDREDNVLFDTADPVLCPPYVYGFSLEKKEWCKLFVDSLQQVEWKPNALDSLILPGPQKRLLQGLVTAHKFPDKARDSVGLKGKGLVVLLHGTPGSGKTLTAEMTAEHTHRALFNISTGELGSYQHYIEIELKRLLTYASTFQAIVLIDEADVFLEARTSGPSDQLEQNAMVAVFLRQLEYFQGIVFLTSNRVSVFDAAIKSRIHLALQYSPPAQDIRRLLWRKHLASVPAEELGLDIEEALNKMQGAKMNGREISNSITTARTLAMSEGAKLRLEDLETIVLVWGEFEKSLNLKGTDGTA